MAKVPQDPEQSFMETDAVQPLCEISLVTGTAAQGTLVSLRAMPGQRGRGWEGVSAFRGPPASLAASSRLPKCHPLRGPQVSWVVMGSWKGFGLPGHPGDVLKASARRGPHSHFLQQPLGVSVMEP